MHFFFFFFGDKIRNKRDIKLALSSNVGKLRHTQTYKLIHAQSAS